ncbi:MAG: hypothetical protein Q7K43_01845 [Candidatus Woesearchaeota archaeon]|nr:hypothetical protein [Candidatus Woesearchaeota archaeon]
MHSNNTNLFKLYHHSILIMKKRLLFVLFLSVAVFLIASFSINSAMAFEAKCVAGAGPEGQFLTKKEGGCCLEDKTCCNYPATKAWCAQTKLTKDLVPFKEIKKPVKNEKLNENKEKVVGNTKSLVKDEKLNENKGKVVGKIESLKGKVEVEQEDGKLKELKAGDEIKFLDHIKVGKASEVTIKVIDGTPLTLSENSYSVIDEFYYDPNQSFLERTFNKYTEGIFSWITKWAKGLEKRRSQRDVESAAAVRG